MEGNSFFFFWGGGGRGPFRTKEVPYFLIFLVLSVVVVANTLNHTLSHSLTHTLTLHTYSHTHTHPHTHSRPLKANFTSKGKKVAWKKTSLPPNQSLSFFSFGVPAGWQRSGQLEKFQFESRLAVLKLVSKMQNIYHVPSHQYYSNAYFDYVCRLWTKYFLFKFKIVHHHTLPRW